jgi:hypothetical protein
MKTAPIAGSRFVFLVGRAGLEPATNGLKVTLPTTKASLEARALPSIRPNQRKKSLQGYPKVTLRECNEYQLYEIHP